MADATSQTAHQLDPTPPSRPDRDDGHIKYVAHLPGAAEDALKAFIGRPFAGWQDRAEHRDGDPLALLVRFEAPSGESVEVELGSPNGGRAFFAGDHITLSYRSTAALPDPMANEGARALIEAVKQRVAAQDAQEQPVVALREAMQRWRTFSPVGDWMYRQSSPQEALIRLGFRCNQDCWFCWQGRDWPEPPAEYYFKWLDAFAAEGREQVTFSGGEPTLHKALPELVARAKALGMRSWLQTNAIQLSKPKILQRLVDAGVAGLFVSYHSHDPEVSDRMTRAPGTHGRTRAGVEASLAAGLHVQINCVVERENHDHLAAHAADLIERFVKPFPDNPLKLVAYSHPCEYYDEDVWARSVVSLEHVQPQLVAALKLLTEHGVTVEGIGTCGFPPCLLADEPQLLRWLVPEDQHAMDTAGRIYAEACDACAVKQRCMGLRKEYMDLMGDAGVRPFATEP